MHQRLLHTTRHQGIIRPLEALENDIIENRSFQKKRKRREPKPKTSEQNKLLSCLEVVDERVLVAYGC